VSLQELYAKVRGGDMTDGGVEEGGVARVEGGAEGAWDAGAQGGRGHDEGASDAGTTGGVAGSVRGDSSSGRSWQILLTTS